jgi:hypothetical protein
LWQVVRKLDKDKAQGGIMKRRIEPVDLMVAIGVFATIVGGYFLFMAADGILESEPPLATNVEEASAVNGMNGLEAAMQWVQPALGEAIVQNYLLERQVNSDIAIAAKELNHATLRAQTIDTDLTLTPADIAARMAVLDADHASYMEYVLGRSIVVFTGRGVRSGILSPSLIDGPYNRHMVALTEERGTRMDASYQETREPMLGRAIVETTQGAIQSAEQIQARVGNAVIRMASLQEESHALGGAQTQLALVMVAAIHAEEMADRFATLASAEQSLQTASTTFAEPRNWPEVPGSVLIAGSIGLIGVFFVVLTMAPTRPETAPTMREVPSEPVYRKTA